MNFCYRIIYGGHNFFFATLRRRLNEKIYTTKVYGGGKRKKKLWMNESTWDYCGRKVEILEYAVNLQFTCRVIRLLTAGGTSLVAMQR